MKVWVAEQAYEYEGGSTIGVFTTKEKAIAHCHAVFQQNYESIDTLNFIAAGDTQFNASWQSIIYSVTEWELE